MRVVHWNISERGGPEFATAKYERELYGGLVDAPDLRVRRIQRRRSAIRGSTVVSWVDGYRTSDADVAHATFQTVAPAGFFHRADRFVVTVHDLAPLVYPDEISDLSERIQWWLTPRALRLADRIIAISEFTRDELRRLVDLGDVPVDVVHQGVDHDRYRPMDSAGAKEHFDLAPESKHVLVVSSSVQHKRVSVAGEVLDRLESRAPDVTMVKAGYGHALEDDRIVSTGWVDEGDMPILYNAADVYLHLSEYEGFGLPVLEAMACGTPIVAREAASIPEVVGDSTDLLPSDAGADAFCERILTTLEGEEGSSVLERSRQFSWRRTVEETVDVYRRAGDDAPTDGGRSG